MSVGVSVLFAPLYNPESILLRTLTYFILSSEGYKLSNKSVTEIVFPFDFYNFTTFTIFRFYCVGVRGREALLTMTFSLRNNDCVA